MADDPVAVTVAEEINLQAGLKFISGTFVGPSDYDSTNGAVMDLSDYLQTIKGGVSINGCSAISDTLIKADYMSQDLTNAATGVVVFCWSADGTDGEPFITVTNATDLDAYVWHFSAFGTEVTRT